EGTHGGAGKGGRLQDDELPALERVTDQVGSGEHRTEIGILGLGHRRGDAHEDRVRLPETRPARFLDPEAGTEGSAQASIVDVVDWRATAAEIRDPLRAGVDTGDRDPGLDE